MSEEIRPIREAIRQKALTQVQEILSNAESEARKIVQEARERAKEATMRMAKPEAAMIRRRILGLASLEGRKLIMEAREETLSKVFKAVEERLHEIANRRTFDYDELLVNLIREAAAEIGEKKLIIAGNERDQKYLKKNLSSIRRRLSKDLGYKVELEVESNPHDCIGGVVVFNADKTKIFYNTLEGRLLKLRDVLKWELSNILFG